MHSQDQVLKLKYKILSHFVRMKWDVTNTWSNLNTNWRDCDSELHDSCH